MSETSTKPDSATVTDHRPVPRGVLPRGMQTWLMVGVAIGMIAIIVVAGRPGPAARPASTSPTTSAPNADRVREYQDRLRALESRAAQDARIAALAPASTPMLNDEPRPTPAAPDPIVAERTRRAYESLFASNVVLSRRPDAQRPDAGRSVIASNASATTAHETPGPSIDELA